MNSRAKQLLEDVLSLPIEEQKELTSELIEKLETRTGEGIDQAWVTEIERRAREALKPEWQGRDAEDVLDDIRRALHNNDQARTR